MLIMDKIGKKKIPLLTRLPHFSIRPEYPGGLTDEVGEPDGLSPIGFTGGLLLFRQDTKILRHFIFALGAEAAVKHVCTSEVHFACGRRNKRGRARLKLQQQEV